MLRFEKGGEYRGTRCVEIGSTDLRTTCGKTASSRIDHCFVLAECKGRRSTQDGSLPLMIWDFELKGFKLWQKQEGEK